MVQVKQTLGGGTSDKEWWLFCEPNALRLKQTDLNMLKHAGFDVESPEWASKGEDPS